MEANIIDLRYHMKTVLAALDRGEPLTIVYRGRAKARPHAQEDLHCVSEELLQCGRSKRESAELRRFFRQNDFEVAPLDEAISHAALALMEEHTHGDGLQLADALIAATAQQLGDELFTGNVPAFPPVERYSSEGVSPPVRPRAITFGARVYRW